MKRVYAICTLLILSVQALFTQQIPFATKLKVKDSGYIFLNAPFNSCHASSIVALPGKKIMAVWFGGSNEGNPDVSIWSSIYANKKWSVPKEIANGAMPDGTRNACWNPVLFRNSKGLLFLHYKTGTSPRTWWAVMKTSVDNGKTWSASKKLPEGFLGPIKNKPVQLVDGDILYPSSIETNDEKWTIHLERSDADGNNWRKTSVNCDNFDIIQPSILQYGGDTLQLLCRSKQNVIAQSWSYDNGKSWLPVTATTLPNPNSGIDAVTLKNGWQVLVYNPGATGKNWWEGRSVLKLAISVDGILWKNIMTLEEHAAGEYSYPAIIQSGDEGFFITYTYDRRNIKYLRVCW